MLRRFFIHTVVLAKLMAVGLSAHASVDASLVLTPSGHVLHEKNARMKLYPASLTKLMTVYIVLEAIRNEKLTFNTHFVASANAARMPASKLGIKQGDRISVRDALLSLLVKSCNDVSVVLAEGVAGSQRNFVRLMNAKAIELGMYDTNFENASGWHDPGQVTTAHDMARLAIALTRDFPEYNYLFAANSFRFKSIRYKHPSPVKRHLHGIECMKTGFHSHAGWNMVTTAKRGQTRLVGVILGGRTHQIRDRAMMRMMDKYFALSSLRAKFPRDKEAKYG